ncbi:MAG: hypothetical protein H6726_27220 [Sandaracinaceae bacterium]|nr:hypothetical protein [Sandaracinaceae bacterium]
MPPTVLVCVFLAAASLVGCNSNGGVGSGGARCFSNRTCLPGYICDSDDRCRACDQGTAGCDCFGNGTCASGLRCEMDICTTGTNRIVPQDPQCYSPCQTGFTDGDGTYRACSVEGLMEGCLDGFVCVNGSCAASAEDPAPSCATDAECPDFQVCILGSCYSNCEYDSDCGGMARCYRHSCRVPCSAADSESCPDTTHCELTDSDFGYCMPSPEPTAALSNSEVEGAFTLSATTVRMTNVDPGEVLTLTHDAPRSIDFTVRKVSHTVFGDTLVHEENSPMPWLGVGAPGAVQNVQTYTVTVPAGSTGVSVELLNAQTGPPPRWEGVLEVSSELGTRRVTIAYSRSTTGRWMGKVFYFTQFGDVGLDAWVNGGPASAVDNALIQRWDALRRGDLSTFEFESILTSTITESWRTASGPGCGAVACYPSVTSNAGGAGLGVYSTDASDGVPSGIVELPIALDIRLDDATHMTGRIATEESLQYAGDPEVRLAFEQDPTQCSNLRLGTCLGFLSDFSATIAVGGRYATTAGDSNCAASSGAYEHTRTPWLVPGFLRDTAEDPETGVRYSYECRDDMQPFGLGSASLNASLSGSNPIPDGRARVRQLQLVDGALVNQERMYVFFREDFEGEFVGGATSDFGAYGLMVLTRVNAELEDEAYEGNAQADDRDISVALSDAARCDAGLLTRTNLTAAPADAVRLANVLINGSAQAPTGGVISSGMHYLCHDTGLFDGGPYAVGAVTPCPAGSGVTYFQCQSGACTGNLRTLPCQNNGTCQTVLNSWVAASDTNVLLNPLYSCSDGAYCDDDRSDLLDGKTFYAPGASNGLVFNPIRVAIAEAFRYKTQFQNREGRSIGFAPQICVPGSTANPYCYDPAAIEEIRDRVSCLAYLGTSPAHRTVLNGQTATRDALDDFLTVAFSYETIPDPTLPVDPTVDGFEPLYAQLLIMLGDEQYTQAFQSRFDLAGQSLVSFEGRLFEPQGIDLSGVAGFEMYTLYQAAQYYELALDRFYSLLEYLWASLANSSVSAFVTQETITSYLGRVLRASTQRARAYGEIARRYQGFNRADLARRVVERSYTSAYLESMVIARLIEEVIEVRASPAERDQLVAELERAATVYKIALLDMRELYGDFTDELNTFGFAQDYIPLPALDPNGPNAVETLLARARNAAAVAASREDLAINSSRTYETDEAAFQSELTNIRNNYENQLAELCGTMIGTDGVVYPAIRRYAHLNPTAAAYQDPCGVMGNGAIHNASAQIEIAGIDIQGIGNAFFANQEAIKIEEGRMVAQCDLIDDLADLEVIAAGRVSNLQGRLRTAQAVVDEVQRGAENAFRTLSLIKCTPPTVGTANSPGDCPAAVGVTVAYTSVQAAAMVARASQLAITNNLQTEIERVQVQLTDDRASVQCQQLLADGLARTQTMALEAIRLELDATRAEYQLRLAFAEVTRLRNQASRVEAEQRESEQLAINVQAARNDPNVRIYKNDAIINADLSFRTAVREAYRATRVFEYYTSQSYARVDELSLVRLVARGDHNLENYLADLEEEYFVFLEDVGRPDNRVDILSLRDDVLQIPRYADDGTTLTQAERVERFRVALSDPQWLSPSGHLTIPFNTSVARLSPLTRNHKLSHIEVELIGSDVGDAVGRVYLTVSGTGLVTGINDENSFYRFPERTAVVNTFFNGVRSFTPDIYQNQRLRERPYVNTNWEFAFNQRDEFVNQDVNLGSLTDVRIYLYYTDFTAF